MESNQAKTAGANVRTNWTNSRDKGTTETIDIIPAYFTASKNEPLRHSGFRIYRQDDKIVAELEKPVKGFKPLRCNLEEGKLNLVVRPNACYSYFRSARFQSFLDKHGINRVRSIDPNGEYHVRNGQYKNNVDDYSVITNGSTAITSRSSLRPGEEPAFQVRHSNITLTVKGATFALVQQVTIKQSDEGKESIFRLRELITTTDIYTMDEALVDHTRTLEAAITELLL